MIKLGTERKINFVPGIGIHVITPQAAAAAWWLSGGISSSDVAGVWQAKSAASLAASYLRLDGDQGYANIDPAVTGRGVAPTWNSGSGWIFDGISQCLDTGIVPVGGWSMFIQFSDALDTTGDNLCGISEGTQRFYLAPTNMNGYFVYGIGNNYRNVAPEALAGVFGFAGLQGYRNGVVDGAPSGGFGGGFTLPIIVGAQSDGSAGPPHISRWTNAKVQKFVVYKITISAAQALAVATAMAAL